MDFCNSRPSIISYGLTLRPQRHNQCETAPQVKGNSLKKMAAEDNETWLWNCDDPEKSLRFAGRV